MKKANPDVGVLPLRALWRDLLCWPLYAAVALVLLAAALPYQVRHAANFAIDVGAQGDEPYLKHFYEPQSATDAKGAKTSYRWSGYTSDFILPGSAPGIPYSVTLSLAGHPPPAPPAVVTVTVGAMQVGVLQPANDRFSLYSVAIPAESNSGDNLIIDLASNAFSPGGGDTRELGVAVDSVTMQAEGRGLALPPATTLEWLAFSMLLLFLTLRRVGFTSEGSLLCTVPASLAIGLILLYRRYDLTVFTGGMALVMACVFALALLVPPAVRWSMKRLRVHMSPMHLRWLMVIYLLAFALKAGGMLHPQFIQLDQVFRAHQVQEMVHNFPAFWEKYQHVTTADQETGTIHGQEGHTMLGQWNLVVPFPYSPVGYMALAPFGWIWPSCCDDRIVEASDISLAALSGTLLFALYAIAQRGLNNGTAGVITAVISQFAPISYLHFSDGAYPYILANWLAIVYIAAAVCLADRAARAGPFLLLTLLSALTLLSHTAIVFLAFPFVALSVLFGWLKAKTQPGTALPRRTAAALALSFLAGGLVSLIYYGSYIIPLLTISIPALAGKAESSGVGQERRYLGDRLLAGFWPQLSAHFASWPALLALAGLLLLIPLLVKRTGPGAAGEAVAGNSIKPMGGESAATRRPMQETLMPETLHITDNIEPVSEESAAAARQMTLILLAAWTATFLLFSLLDLRVNLLQRHMIFALPLLALLAGYALARMQGLTALPQRLSPAGLLTLLLVVGLILTSSKMWLDRVLHYMLPPGSG
ncbi:MAG: hypothetical protein M3014_03795 [Chloroflexota bacterium]|nr:hypothetical protein [Chloroflexota bacterium]